MDLKNYTTPAIVAAAAHAALFLLAPDIPAIVRDDTKVIHFDPPEKPKDQLPLESPADLEAEEGEAGGAPVLAPPMLPEPAAVVAKDAFEVPIPPVVPRDDSTPADIFQIDPKYYRPAGPGDGPGKTNGPGVIRFSELDREPRYRARSAPDYPFSARQSGLDGEVVVEFDVDATGRVVTARVLRSTDRVFEEPAMRAVLQWRFEPGRKNGRTVAFRMAVPIVFSLENR